jgi:uncharacterized protein
MKTNNRRTFLKQSIIGISGVAIAPGLINGGSNAAGLIAAPPELPMRVLGKTGIRIPLISMGTADATDPGFIRAAYEAGIKLFFSATYYGEGKNEELVGQGLKGLPRDSFVIGTAVPPDGMDNRTGTFPKGFDAEAYIKKAEGSLKRFGLDHVDFMLFPYAGKKETVQHEGVLKALAQLKKQGKTRFLGIASHSDTEEALKAAADAGIYDVAMPAYNYKLTNKESMNEAIAYAAKAGMGIVAMKSTAGAARDKSGVPVNINAALKWILQNDKVTSIVSGMSNLEQLQKNLAMIKDLKMTDQELKDLKLATGPSETGLYCHQCKECLPQCPGNVDIPAIMRSYMYAYGYKDLRHAWYTMSDAAYSDQCQECGTCKVECRAGFDVKKKVLDISRLGRMPQDLLLA